MSWLWNFCRFWYDFIFGDDWTIAVAVVAGVAATAGAAQVGFTAGIVLPAAVAVVLVWSISHVRTTKIAGDTASRSSVQ